MVPTMTNAKHNRPMMATPARAKIHVGLGAGPCDSGERCSCIPTTLIGYYGAEISSMERCVLDFSGRFQKLYFWDCDRSELNEIKDHDQNFVNTARIGKNMSSA
jgi:hypothetical protein